MRGLNCVYQNLLIVYNYGFQCAMFIHVYSLLIFTPITWLFLLMLSSSLPGPLLLSSLFLVCFGDPAGSSGCVQEPRQGLICRNTGALSAATLLKIISPFSDGIFFLILLKDSNFVMK